MSLLLVLPVFWPLLTAAALLGLRRSARLKTQVSALSAAGLLAVAGGVGLAVAERGVVVAQMGGWSAPYGITLAADALTAVMLAVIALVFFATVLYGRDRREEADGGGSWDAVLHVLVAGLAGVVLAGDLFNLFVWFEVVHIASFVLLVLGGRRRQIAGAVKYVIPNLLSSALLLAGVSLLYHLAGTLNFADLVGRLGSAPPGLVTAASMLILLALAIKAAAFPFWFWLPAAYPTAPPAISALLAGLLTKVAAYALLRLFTQVLVDEPSVLHAVIRALAGLTMLIGVVGAAAQKDTRRLLAFHVVAEVGYVLMGIGLGTRLALIGALIFLVQAVVAKTALFMIMGIVRRIVGTWRFDEPGGLYARRPGLSALFLVAAFSVAGIPPLPGFFGKLGLVRAGLAAGAEGLVSVALVSGVISLWLMLRLWNRLFWAEDGLRPEETNGSPGMRQTLPTALLAATLIALALAAGPATAVAARAADAVGDSADYVRAVLPGEGA